MEERDPGQLFEQLISSVMVCLMNGILYFPGHRKVAEGAAAVQAALALLLARDERIIVGLREGQLIFRGRPYFDVSNHAQRLIRVMEEKGVGAIVFNRGTQAPEIIALITVLLAPKEKVGDVPELNQALSSMGAGHLTLDTASDLAEAKGTTTGLLPAKLLVPKRAYQEAVGALQEALIDLREGRPINIEATKSAVNKIIDSIESDGSAMLSMSAERDYDEYTHGHSVNVSILTMAIMVDFVPDRQELLEIGKAALLHDIGKLLIPEEILQKAGKLSDEEWEVMKRHTVDGARALLETPGAGELAVTIAYSHHLHYRGGGYPPSHGEVDRHPLGLLVSIIDTYEALTATRPYKEKVPPDRAVSLILDSSGTRFHPGLVKLFVEKVGIYPIGCVVELSNRAQGVIVPGEERNIYRPTVRVTEDPAGVLPDSLQQVNLADLERWGDLGVERIVSFDNRFSNLAKFF